MLQPYGDGVPDAFDLRFARYDHPDAGALTERAQQYYVDLYGGPDRDLLTPDQFAPPVGGFFLGYADGEAVAMGGWTSVPPTSSGPSTSSGRREDRWAQIRRMYVSPTVRGRGYGPAVLRALEQDATRRGTTQMILSTGPAQIQAVRLYRAAGYTDIEPFGFYAAKSGAIHLGKDLR
jgi:GNAT superfamily N-acetyltransferase